MHPSRPFVITLALLALLLLPATAVAQQEQPAPGRLTGEVVDPDTREPLKGTRIRIVGTELRTRTDEEGRFKIEAVPPGTYSVVVEKRGYAMITFRNVDIRPGAERELSVELPAVARASKGEHAVAVPPQLANPTRASRILSQHYPLRAREWGISADVTLKIQVSAEGKLLDARIRRPSGYREFDEAALKAVRQIYFQPALNAAGEPIAAWMEFPIHFEGR